MGERTPFPNDPDDFPDDQRISFSREKAIFILEDENGQEWEWRSGVGRWAQAWTEDEEAQHAEVYGPVATDDTDAAANTAKKRKQANEDVKAAKMAKREQARSKPRGENKAVFVSNIPETASMQQIEAVFRKFGMIAESINNDEKRIKMYRDPKGNFKGEALIIYHRPESVLNACALADGAQLDPVHPNPYGPMRVTVADESYKRHNADEAPEPEADNKKKRGPGGNQEKKRAQHKSEEMNSRLADWDSSGDEVDKDDHRVLIITNAFRPRELQEDGGFQADLEQDMREEAETHGKVKHIIVYDEDGAGALAIHFHDAGSAARCATKCDGRMYNGRALRAYTSDGRVNFKRSDPKSKQKSKPKSAPAPDRDSDES